MTTFAQYLVFVELVTLVIYLAQNLSFSCHEIKRYRVECLNTLPLLETNNDAWNFVCINH